MADVLGAFSLGTDLGMAQTMGHVLRACYIAMRLARELKLSDADQSVLYYSVLLMHSGCAASSAVMAALVRSDEMDASRDLTQRDYSNPLEIIEWLARNVAPEAPFYARVQYIVQAIANAPRFRREGEIGTCEVGALMARRLGMPTGVAETLLNLYEHWDGTGYKHLRGEQIPLGARLVEPASMLEIFHETRGRAAMENLARAQRGKVFAPNVADSFLSLAQDARFWMCLSVSPFYSSYWRCTNDYILIRLWSRALRPLRGLWLPYCFSRSGWAVSQMYRNLAACIHKTKTELLRLTSPPARR
jgi:hypothetical protein